MFYNVHNNSSIKTWKYFINKNKYLCSEYILKDFLIKKVYFQNILETSALMVKNYVLEQGSATFSCRPILIHGLFLTEGEGENMWQGLYMAPKD